MPSHAMHVASLAKVPTTLSLPTVATVRTKLLGKNVVC
jgi:hypothetical protein